MDPCAPSGGSMDPCAPRGGLPASGGHLGACVGPLGTEGLAQIRQFWFPDPDKPSCKNRAWLRTCHLLIKKNKADHQHQRGLPSICYTKTDHAYIDTELPCLLQSRGACAHTYAGAAVQVWCEAGTGTPKAYVSLYICLTNITHLHCCPCIGVRMHLCSLQARRFSICICVIGLCVTNAW